MDVRDHLEKAIERAGSEAKLGEATGYSQNAIWQAKVRGRVSPEMALSIHRAFNGEFPASLFRPDLWRSPEDVPVTPTLTPAQKPERARAS